MKNPRPAWALLAPLLALPAALATEAPEAAAVSEDPFADRFLGNAAGVRPALARRGLDFSATYTGELLANVSGGLDRGGIAAGLLKLQLDFDPAGVGLWPDGTFHFSSLTPHGGSLTEDFLGDLFTLSNLDAPDGWRLFEAWYEQRLLNDRVSLRVGQLAADEEFAGTDYGCLFINGTCGWPAHLALNTPSPAYPVAALGARIAFQPADWLRWQTAVYDGDPNPVDAGGQRLNPDGIYAGFNAGALVLSELGFAWNQSPAAARPPGRARLGGWHHTGDFDHLRLDETGRSLADPASDGRPRALSGNWGAYATVEQALWREHPGGEDAQGLGAFVRLGYSPGEASVVGQYVEAGLVCRGLVPGRDDDECGVAFVHGRLNDELRRLARDEYRFNGTTGPLPDHETVVEACYRVAVRSGWTAQPTFEWILHPGGSAATPDAIVIGLRTVLEF